MPETTPYPAPDAMRGQEREHIRYLLGNEPGWMTRYGIAAMAAVFALLAAGSYWMRFPDVIEAKVVLTMSSPPIRVLADGSGRIAELLTKEGDQVEAGQVLAAMENTADRRDVMRLETWLDAPGSELPASLRLGHLQGVYSTYAQHWKDLQYFYRHHGAEEQVAALRRQIGQLQAVNENLREQQRIMQQELDLAANEKKRQQLLFDEKVISEKEWDAAQAAYLTLKRQIENAAAAVLQNELQAGQLESRIAELEQTHTDRANEKELALAEDAQRLRSAIAEWKQNFLITAPVSGQVSLYRIWSPHQSVAPGEEILAVSPVFGKAGGIIGKAELPAEQSGKVAAGQPVSIRLDGYPSEQFGSIETKIASISLLPREEIYLVDMYLPDTLRTSYGKIIPFHPEMSGAARIITEDRRVIDRIFGRLREILQY